MSPTLIKVNVPPYQFSKYLLKFSLWLLSSPFMLLRNYTCHIEISIPMNSLHMTLQFLLLLCCQTIKNLDRTHWCSHPNRKTIHVTFIIPIPVKSLHMNLQLLPLWCHEPTLVTIMLSLNSPSPAEYINNINHATFNKMIHPSSKYILNIH
mgnify:CR=1 FL=1